jgi:cytochrome c-type biogenesis protein
MIEAPSIFLAFTAGFLSFLSPCCLPLVPGYLATVIGSRTPGAPDVARTVVVRRSLLFIGTFSLLFILLGLAATAAGSLLLDNRQTLDTVAGIAMILLGAVLVGSIFVTALGREWRSAGLMERASSGGPIIAAAAFAPRLDAVCRADDGSHPRPRRGQPGHGAGRRPPSGLFPRARNPDLLLGDRVRANHPAPQGHEPPPRRDRGSRRLILIGMGFLVLTVELYRLNIEAERVISEAGRDFFYNL